MYPGNHGQAPGAPAPGPGPVGPPGGGGDSWNPIQGMGGSGSGLALGGALGQTMLSGPGTMLNQGLGMNTLGAIITNSGPSPTTHSGGASAMMPPSNISPIGSGSLTPPGDGSQPHFLCPRRPNLGREGRPIVLRANHFQVSNKIHILSHATLDIYDNIFARFLCPVDTFTTI